MEQISRIGMDTSKHLFQLHGVNTAEEPVLRKKLQRTEMFAFLQKRAPTVIAIEDLHWADPSTLELLQLLVDQGAMARLLLLYTARPEFHAPWPPRTHHTQITLNRLSARNVRTMVEEVAARRRCQTRPSRR